MNHLVGDYMMFSVCITRSIIDDSLDFNEHILFVKSHLNLNVELHLARSHFV